MDTNQRPVFKKVIDVILARFAFEIGENDIVDGIKKIKPEELLDKLSEIESMMEQHSWQLTQLSPKDLFEIHNILKIFREELGGILSFSKFGIHEKAVQEIAFSGKYGRDTTYQTLDTLFNIVNKDRVNLQLQYFKNTSIDRLYEVDINKKARIYFTINPNMILGFDFEHKRSDHSDVIKRLEVRR